MQSQRHIVLCRKSPRALARWLPWLERHPVHLKAAGLTPGRPGHIPRLQAAGCSLGEVHMGGN